MMLEKYIRRADGRVEQICEHGVGHTVDDGKMASYMLIHGCDGCCAKVKNFGRATGRATPRGRMKEKLRGEP